MFEQPIVMLDFETTGLSPGAGDRITEVAALRIVDGRITERFVSLVNCEVFVPPDITCLTGITQAMVDNAPSAARVMPTLLDFIGDDALSAHNASFDERFLHAESSRLGLTPRHRLTICSLKLARRMLPGLASYRLSALSSSLGMTMRGAAHRAEADAEASANVLMQIGTDLAAKYAISSVRIELSHQLNCLAASKVPKFLAKEFERSAPTPIQTQSLLSHLKQLA